MAVVRMTRAHGFVTYGRGGLAVEDGEKVERHTACLARNAPAGLIGSAAVLCLVRVQSNGAEFRGG